MTLFLQACRGGPIPRIPVWAMRQAGRYLPQYQALREKHSFWDLCVQPELAAQATLDAALYLQTDAAIIFSDITLPGWAMGLQLEFSPGPKFSPRVVTTQDVARLKDVDPARDLGFVLDAIRLTRKSLPLDVSLIGFVGAPLSLACYLIEGTPTRTWQEAKRLIYGNPKTAHALLERVTECVTQHALAQWQAGCDTIQLFDSLAGEFAEVEIKTFAFAYAEKVITKLKKHDIPVIYFARNIGGHLEAAADLGAHVLGLDWSVSIRAARERLKDRTIVMGNLDPGVLFASQPTVIEKTRDILSQAQGAPAFIFNLGHGVLPGTPHEHVKTMVDTVHACSWS